MHTHVPMRACAYVHFKVYYSPLWANSHAKRL